MKSTIILLIILIYTNRSFGQVTALLDTNDISAKISADGRLFDSKFEIPKGSKVNTILTGGIWIAGFSEHGNLSVAAQTNDKTLVDYFFGPISSNYNDSIYVKRYKNVWKINKSTIDDHRLKYKSLGYVLPLSISKWPGNGNTANGEAKNLAPYIDINSNNLYDPENGDYPDIRGDQAVYCIINDDKNAHAASHGEKFGFEIHIMAYSFEDKSDSALMQTVFVNYQIYNRSIYTYHDVYIGSFVDMNIGSLSDDYVGCDSILNMFYTYNSTNFDNQYGNNPPAQGCVILNTPMTSFIASTNSTMGNYPPAMTDPYSANEFFNYLTGRWRDGSPLTRKGLGYNPGSFDLANFFCNGDPEGKGWSEVSENNTSGDRRCLSSTGPFKIPTGEKICFDLAFPFARNYKGSNLSSVSLLRSRVQSIQEFYNQQEFDCPNPMSASRVNELSQTSKLISIYPNPSNGVVNIKSEYPIDLIKICPLNCTRVSSYKVQEDNELIVSDLAPGIYFIEGYKDNMKLVSCKLIIVN